LKIESHDEFEIIAQSFNKMLTDIRELIYKNNEETKRSMLAEIKQLESQLNPHFLFNTLETIRCLAKYSPASVDRIIVNLSSLLRYSINNTIKNVTLGEDIEHTENYLEILKYRFNQNLDYEINIEAQALECIVPKLLIQPIIENAVKHGFECRSHLWVRVKGRFLDDKLIIVIFDDGVGMEEEKVKKITEMLKDDSNDTINIGLYNVNRRIKLMFGKEYGLDIMSEKDAGTTVRICLPADQSEEYHG
jgi:sensor histidine kinase YesM